MGCLSKTKVTKAIQKAKTYIKTEGIPQQNCVINVVDGIDTTTVTILKKIVTKANTEYWLPIRCYRASFLPDIEEIVLDYSKTNAIKRDRNLHQI